MLNYKSILRGDIEGHGIFVNKTKKAMVKCEIIYWYDKIYSFFVPVLSTYKVHFSRTANSSLKIKCKIHFETIYREDYTVHASGANIIEAFKNALALMHSEFHSGEMGSGALLNDNKPETSLNYR